MIRSLCRRRSSTVPKPQTLSGQPLASSTPDACLVAHSFLPDELAVSSRKLYDNAFADGRDTASRHFGFDLWHIPNSFTNFRTPASDFFGGTEWPQLEQSLVDFGREFLGCHAITPPWLSVYLDGCEQRLHTDVWQGPFAFSLSLSGGPGGSKSGSEVGAGGDSMSLPFHGGETELLSPHVLDWWRDFNASPNAGAGQQGGGSMDSQNSSSPPPPLVRRIPPSFNQLLAFDPRVPHSVSRVSGVGGDPRRARVSVHGWFAEPATCVVRGGLVGVSGAEEEVDAAVTNALLSRSGAGSGNGLGELPRCIGPLVVRVVVSPQGTVVGDPVATFDSLMADPAHAEDSSSPAAGRLSLIAEVDRALRSLQDLPRADEPSYVTIPLVFE